MADELSTNNKKFILGQINLYTKMIREVEDFAKEHNVCIDNDIYYSALKIKKKTLEQLLNLI